MRLAIAEATDLAFVPAQFHVLRETTRPTG